jgi:hypothetical protein
MVQSLSIDALERLQRQAFTLKAQAEQMTQSYNRTTWIRFVLVFFPIPFIVLLLRLHIDAWAYYVAGAGIVVSAAVLYMLDGAASAKVDAAVEAAARAQHAYDEALKDSRRECSAG